MNSFINNLILIKSNTSFISKNFDFLIWKRWATKKSGGGSKNGRDSNPKYLGIKKFGGETVVPGNIIVRQRGTKFHAGFGVGVGRDHTLYALVPGFVRYSYDNFFRRKFVHVESRERYSQIFKIQAYARARKSKKDRYKIWPQFCPSDSPKWDTSTIKNKK